jgi:hypothetical protein
MTSRRETGTERTFHVSYRETYRLKTNELQPLGFRILYPCLDGRCDLWSIELESGPFRRKVDAEMAMNALVKAGITPDMIDKMEDEQFNDIDRIMSESLQW